MKFNPSYRSVFKIASKGRVLLCVSAIVSSLSAAPSGGVVVHGDASIKQKDTNTYITQQSQKAIINWHDFSINKGEKVSFIQPDSKAMTLNKVTGKQQSILAGELSANGKVFLINPNGVVISNGAKVDTAGFLASTLDISNKNFLEDNFVFEANGSQGSVINLGTIHVSDESYVALLGKEVKNQGVIIATKGTVALSSGDKITLNFNGNSLVDVTIDEGTLNSLVETKQAIYADGGKVILTAKAADDLIASQVNVEGLIQAHTIDDLKSDVLIYAYGGQTNIGSAGGDTLIDASAPISGDGGFVETSGDKVTIADSATITTKSQNGKSGTWLIDPVDFTIGIGGDITGAKLSQQLSNNNVVIESVKGTKEGKGDIYVNDSVSWSANKLTLDAQNSIYVNNVMNATGSASFIGKYGSGTNSDGSVNGIYMAFGETGTFAGKLNFNSSGNISLGGNNYEVINSIEKLQGMVTGVLNNTKYYVLGDDIDLSSIGNWSGLNYSYVNFNGLGHTVNNLKSTTSGLFGDMNTSPISNLGVINANITATITGNGQGKGILANVIGGGSDVINTFTTGSLDVTATATGIYYVGGLLGSSSGYVANSYSTANITAGGNTTTNQGQNGRIGGLLGNAYAVSDSFATGNIKYKNAGQIGGLVGYANSYIRRSFATGDITNFDENTVLKTALGGLVGETTGMTSNAFIQDSFATGNITYNAGKSAAKVGGFAGATTLQYTISNAYATGNVINKTSTANGGYVGGFVGQSGSAINNAYAIGNVTGGAYIGGFGGNVSGAISNAYATGNVTADISVADALTTGTSAGTIYAGGFAGQSSNISNAYATGNVTAITDGKSFGNRVIYAGGFTGFATGTIANAYATGDVKAEVTSAVKTANRYAKAIAGGFVGQNGANVTNAYATGSVETKAKLSDTDTLSTDSQSLAGGFFGLFNSGTVTDIYATGNATAGIGSNSASTIEVLNDPLKASGTGVFSGTTTPWSVAPNENWDISGATPKIAFDSSVWGSSTNGTPILKTIPLRIVNFSKTYGDNISLGDFTIYGLQGGDILNNVLTYSATPYLSYYGKINAGVYQANDLLSSSTYINIKGNVFVKPKTVTISGATVSNKEYDKTVTATVSSNGTITDGVIAGENLSIDTAQAYFSDKNAGDNKTVFLNYIFKDDSGNVTGNYITNTTTTANITPKTLTANFGIDDKVYDGSTLANVNSSNSGALAGDNVILSFKSANFSDKNVGDNKTVTINGLTLSGVDASNYTLASTSKEETATITKKVLDLAGIKDYDGTNVINASDISGSNIVAGDIVNFSGSATLLGSSVGIHSFNDLSNLVIDNPNYTIIGSVGNVAVGKMSLALSKIVSGDVSVSTADKTTTITQTSDKAIIDWIRFNIAGDETVTFNQLNSKSIVLNRVIGSEKSIINGVLNANGRVFIINSNGVLFSSTAKVNTASLLASTLNISNENFLANNYIFTASGKLEGVINEGDIVIVDDGFVSLISENDVKTTGTITGAKDTILASTNSIKLSLDDTSKNLTSYEITDVSKKTTANGQITTNSLEVAGNEVDINNLTLNTGSTGGLSLTKNSLNDITATFIQKQLLLRNLRLNALNDDITLNDTISYSNKGLILNSAKNIFINNILNATGNAGFMAIWGDGVNSDLTNYGLYTKMSSNDDGTFVGKVNLDSSSNVFLGTKDNINQYTVINDAAGLQAIVGNSYTNYYLLGNDIDLSGITDWTPVDLYATFNGLGHVVENLKSTQGGLFNQIRTTNMRPDFTRPKASGGYELTWDGMATLSNIGVKNASILFAPTQMSNNYIGILANINSGIVSNTFATGSISSTISGDQELYFGGLIGSNFGMTDSLARVLNSYTNVDMTVSGGAGIQRVGGFVGTNAGLIQGSHSVGTITAYGGKFIGGFAGQNHYNGNERIGGRLINDWANMNIILHGGSIVGGFVGSNMSKATIIGSYALGDISGETDYSVGRGAYGASVGGFAGMNTEFSSIDSSYAKGNINVTGVNGGQAGDYVGGFVGFQGDSVAGVDGSTITNSYATGNVTSNGNYVGGFAGRNDYGALIDNSYSNGNVKGRDFVGGFIGINGSEIYEELLKTGNTPGGYFNTILEHITFHNSNYGISKDAVTVAMNRNGATVSNSHSSGTVEATGENATVGAFAGENAYGGKVNNNYVTGDGMNQANANGTNMVGTSGRGDDYISNALGAERGTSSESNNNFGSPTERAQWAKEKAEKEQREFNAKQLASISEKFLANEQKKSGSIIDGFLSLMDKNDRKIKPLIPSIDILSPEYSADIKTFNVDGITYDTEDESEEE